MWNRFWLLLSVLWMGFCWWMASRIEVPKPDAPDLVAYARFPVTAADRLSAIHTIELFIGLGFAGFVLWFAGRFVRHGWNFGFRRR